MYAIANRTSVHVRRNYLTVSLVGLFVAEQQGEVQPPLYLDSLKHTLGRMQALQQSSAPSSLTAPGRHTPRFNGYRFATLDSDRHKWLVHRPLLETATNHFVGTAMSIARRSSMRMRNKRSGKTIVEPPTQLTVERAQRSGGKNA